MSETLHVFFGNSPESLAEIFAEKLQETLPNDPMEPLRFGGAHRGIQRMLEEVLAKRHGIATHLEMVFPTKLMLQIGYSMKHGLPLDVRREHIVWEPELIQWAVYAELERVELRGPPQDDIYAPLRQWLHKAQGGVDGSSRRVQMQLAAQLSRVFDAYNVDRPEWHFPWVEDSRQAQLQLFPNAGGPPQLPPELAWQQHLWRDVYQRLSPQVASPIELLETITQSTDDAVLAQIKRQLPALHLFGVTHLNQTQLRLIDALSEKLPVYLYVGTPTSVFYSDANPLAGFEEGLAPLLARFGRHARFLLDNIITLHSSKRTQSSADYDAVIEIPDTDHALAHIQRAVLSPISETLVPYAPLPDDRSFAFHASHGPLRQIEVLHDAILACMEADPSLEPSDFVVLSPQLDTFAPLIEAIFRSTSPLLPFRIEDRTLENANIFAQAVRKLLELSDERSTTNRFLELLALQPVRSKFNIEEEDLPLLRAWLKRLDVRWGWDEEDRARQGRPGASLSTWQHALHRLILGLMMGPDALNDDPLIRGCIAFTDLSGQHAALVGKFSRFVREVFAMCQTLRQDRSVDAWIECMVGNVAAPERGESSGMIGRLVHAEGNQGFLIEELVQAFRELSSYAKATGIEDNILDADAFREWASGVLEGDKQHIPVGRGAVSFARLNVHRFSSARVVMLLGMDDGSYPRPAQLPSWDARQLQPRPNDHSDRAEDLYAILQALMLAKDHFAVIWQSLDPHFSQPAPPALPVLEMQRLIEAHIVDGPAFLQSRTTQHRMHPFAIESFLKPAEEHSNAPFTYQSAWARAALAGHGPKTPRDGSRVVLQGYQKEHETSPNVSAKHLALALSDPQRTFLRQSAKLNIRPEDHQLSIDDPTAPSRLEQPSLYRALFGKLCREAITGQEEGLTRLRSEAPLRPGKLGDFTVQSLLTDDRLRAVEYVSERLETATPVLYQAKIGRRIIYGRPPYSMRDEESGFTPIFRRLHIDALLEPWTNLCVQAVATQRAATTTILNFHDNVLLFELTVEPGSAQQWLQDAITIHDAMYQGPIPLNRVAMRNAFEKLDSPKKLEKSYNDLLKLYDAASPEELESARTRWFGALQRTWQLPISKNGPSEWALAVLGQEHPWGQAPDDPFDALLLEQIKAIVLPIATAMKDMTRPPFLNEDTP